MEWRLEPLCEGYIPHQGRQCYQYIEGGLCSNPLMFRCTEYIREIEPTLSYSSVKTYLKCHRAFWYEWIQGLQPIEPPLPLLMGTIASKILDIIHDEERSKAEDWRKILYPYLSDSEDSEEIKTWPVAMEAQFRAYIDVNLADEKGKTQYYWQWNIPDYPRVHGYIDCRHYDGKICKEFKYSGNPDWHNRFTIYQQLGTYFLGNREAQRFTVRVIVPPGSKIAKNEGIKTYGERIYLDCTRRPKFYFQDNSYWRSEFKLKVIADRLRTVSQEINQYMAIGFHAFYQSYSCFSPPCPFYKICFNDDTISDQLYKCRDKESKKEDLPPEKPKVEKPRPTEKYEEIEMDNGGKENNDIWNV